MQTNADPILRETVAAIRQILGAELDAITIERLVIGVFFTGVKLSNGFAGACATPVKMIPEAVCCPSSAMAMPFPRRLRGRRALDMLKETGAASGIRRAVGVAVMNALADLCWDRRPLPEWELCWGIDAFDATEIRSDDRVVIVGAFVPFLRALKRRDIGYLVLENDPASLKPDELPFFRPAEQAHAILPTADVALITGTTLVNDTLDGLLGQLRSEARVTLVGPTVSLLPTPLCGAAWIYSEACASRRRTTSWTCWPRQARATTSSAARPSASCCGGGSCHRPMTSAPPSWSRLARPSTTLTRARKEGVDARMREHDGNGRASVNVQWCWYEMPCRSPMRYVICRCVSRQTLTGGLETLSLRIPDALTARTV